MLGELKACAAEASDGDIVVVWCKKRGPLVTRRLARRSPFRTYHFRDLDSGRVFEMPCSKVAAIHSVIG